MKTRSLGRSVTVGARKSRAAVAEPNVRCEEYHLRRLLERLPARLPQSSVRAHADAVRGCHFCCVGHASHLYSRRGADTRWDERLPDPSDG
jgi:hypothetical protein